MSTAEISDNRYEVEASKPPIKTLSAVTQMAIMAFFVIASAWLGLGILKGIFLTPKQTESSIEKQFKNMKAAAPAPAPAAAPPAAVAPAVAPAAAPAAQ